MTTHVHLADQLCFSVYNVNRLFNKFYQEALEPYRLTYPQYLLLTTLWEQDHRELRDLGQTLHLNSNTLTPMVRRLEERGWVTRTHPENDKRRLVVSLTKMARDNEAPIHDALATCLARYQLTIEDYEQALALNQKLQTAFSE
ncbi:transcription regulator [Secundilactobacillus odoratitofui DSM 19909 = JCM 15043]|uniref:HTH-type transcriptional regulator SarZ n=1 Tax=Secundilactobacillus odoratitofui DSM 19909 = JCM 15043 TaxID=1423776 RepID=A0A0R1LRY1_9LACO|nr:MarR family transcriptional regulator [Secundilactobacillus odoratitofui]KRK98604.1 transcription regulator [Secundilactobacillus odoratitofui DSM 19909 = JCM 15043]